MKVLLIDGDYLIARVLHPLAGSTRPNLSATHTSRVTRLLRNLLDEQRPTHVLLIWQGKPARSFLEARRRAIVDTALHSGCSQRIQDMGIHQLKLDGSCTGNILSAITSLPLPPTAQTIILASDQRYYTLLDRANTVLHDPFTHSKTLRWMTPAAFVARFGIQPAQWPLYLAIAGHPATEIKGVPGIGQKNALQMLSDVGVTDIDKIALKAPVRHGLLLRKHMRLLKESYLPQLSLTPHANLPISWPDIKYHHPGAPTPANPTLTSQPPSWNAS